jgi:hypothetical protein
VNTQLLDLATFASHLLGFEKAAKAEGFASPSDINRFLFKSYGKAVKQMAPADRLRGAIFILNAPASPNALAQPRDLITALHRVQSDIDQRIYSLAADISAEPAVAHTPTHNDLRQMVSGEWNMGYAQLISRCTKKCVVWASGVGAVVFLAGEVYLETPDVVEELSGGIPAGFQKLSWDDGEIAYEFARHELNDTSRAGIWHLPNQFLLCPKPEKLMSAALGKFLRNRMAGYWNHDEEPYVENEGRADISLARPNGFFYIIEVNGSAARWLPECRGSHRQRSRRL